MKRNINGSNNPFYGKKHTKEAIEKIRNGDKSWTKTPEERLRRSKRASGKNNSMYGVSVYDIWIKKYGKIIADKKMASYRLKQSINSRGRNNPMYGKPSPNGSGNGWKGWYKNFFFRSILELSYLINVIERHKMPWVSGEKIMIRYRFMGKDRTYRPDFLIKDKYLIECKPKRLHKSKCVMAKTRAALKYCKEHGYIYKLRSTKIINIDKVRKLVDNKEIIFVKKSLERFKKYEKTHSNLYSRVGRGR